MLLYNKREKPSNWEENFNDSINLNNLREFDALHDFSKKYPLATIHFLLCCLREILKIDMVFSNKATIPLLYVDGTFKNLLNYPENCNEWLNFLNAKNPSSPIYPIFLLFSKQRLKDIIHLLEEIFNEFEKIRIGRKRGDKILLKSIRNGEISFQDYFPLLEILSEYTGWEFKTEKWNLKVLRTEEFKKEIENNLTGEKYNEIIEKEPISWAITAGRRMEYTLDISKYLSFQR